MRDDDEVNENDSGRVDTLCPTCGGAGKEYTPKLAIIGGRAQTVMAGSKCPTCRGMQNPGWLPGLQPPV